MPKKDPLGMGTNITRRDFLNSSLIAPGAMLMSPILPVSCSTPNQTTNMALTSADWMGFGGIDDYND